MKAKLALIVLALVVLPTAVLSLIASRALKSWELIIERGIQSTAANAIKAVSDRVQATLDDNLTKVQAAMSDSLAYGGEFSDIDAAATRLRESASLVSGVYLFMNPWGFLYPDDFGASSAGGGATYGESDAAVRLSAERRDALIEALRRKIASDGSAADGIRLKVNDACYYFALLRERNGMYGGFEVDIGGFAKLLFNTISRASDSGFVLFPEGPGITREFPSRQGTIIISDSFHQTSEVGYADGNVMGYGEQGLARSADGNAPIAVQRLMPPFDFITISAFLEHPEETKRAEAQRLRLYGWGIALLAGGIVVGVWFVLRSATAEIMLARARSDFVAGVSHDLRTPVSSLKMLAESLYLDYVPERSTQKKFLGTMVRECELLNQLVERVLFFVRFGQDVLVYRFQELAPDQLVEKVVRVFRGRFEIAAETREAGSGKGGDGSGKGGRAVRVEMDVPLPKVNADESAMTQVILNLLDNAVKYSACRASDVGSEGGRSNGSHEIVVRVAVARRKRHVISRRGSWVEISVKDRGIGIAPKELRKIFRRYYRAPGGREANVSGVGLGLALCRHIVAAHGGWIEATSRLGEGSVFSVLLPCSSNYIGGTNEQHEREEAKNTDCGR